MVLKWYFLWNAICDTPNSISIKSGSIISIWVSFPLYHGRESWKGKTAAALSRQLYVSEWGRCFPASSENIKWYTLNWYSTIVVNTTALLNTHLATCKHFLKLWFNFSYILLCFLCHLLCHLSCHVQSSLTHWITKSSRLNLLYCDFSQNLKFIEVMQEAFLDHVNFTRHVGGVFSTRKSPFRVGKIPLHSIHSQRVFLELKYYYHYKITV